GLSPLAGSPAVGPVPDMGTWRLVPCSKCHTNRISEITPLCKKWVSLTVRIVTGDPRDTTKPSLAPASLSGLLSCWPSWKFRRSCPAAATSRVGHLAGAAIGERRYGAGLGSANMFNRQLGGRPSIAFTRHV